MNMDAFFANNFPAIVVVCGGGSGVSVGIQTVYTVFYTIAQCNLLLLWLFSLHMFMFFSIFFLCLFYVLIVQFEIKPQL